MLIIPMFFLRFVGYFAVQRPAAEPSVVSRDLPNHRQRQPAVHSTVQIRGWDGGHRGEAAAVHRPVPCDFP